jgi:hypothetical protein
MAKKSTRPDSDIYTAILALACFAVLAATVFVTLKSINYYGSESLFKVAKAPR